MPRAPFTSYAPLLLTLPSLLVLGCGGGGSTSATEGATGDLTNITITTVPTSSATGSESEGTVTAGSMSAGMSTGGSTSTTTSAATDSSATAAATLDTTTSGGTDPGSSSGAPGPVCGNGILEDGEECDDGDDVDKNACSNACIKVPCDQQEGPGLDEVLSYIWISNSSQNTVSKIDSLKAANSGEYGGIQQVG